MECKFVDFKKKSQITPYNNLKVILIIIIIIILIIVQIICKNP